MAAVFKEYGATINGELYPCRVNHTIYGQNGIGQTLGFTAPTTSANFNGIGDFSSLKRAGAIVRVNVTGVKVEGGNTIRKTWQLWCVTTALSNARGQLPSKTIDGYDINKVSARRTTRFR